VSFTALSHGTGNDRCTPWANSSWRECSGAGMVAADVTVEGIDGH
jgi:hypothetical protein